MSTSNSQDTSLLSLLRDVNFPVPIAQGPEFHKTFLINYLRRLWTKHHYMATAPFRCICSASPCSIQELLIALGLSKAEDIRLFSQRMECYSGNIGQNFPRWTKSSGVLKKASKSQKNSKNGRTSPSDSSKKGKIRSGLDGK